MKNFKIYFLIAFAIIGLRANSQTFQRTFHPPWVHVDSNGDNRVEQTSDGGYIMSGELADQNAVDVYGYLIKTNSSGDTLWTKKYNSEYSGWHNTYDIRSVHQTYDGGYIATGGFYTNFAGNVNDIFILKTDMNGDTVWTRTFGNYDYEGSWDIKQTSDGGYIFEGYGYGMCLYIIKLTSDGGVTWSKIYPSLPIGTSIQQTTDGGYIILGSVTYSHEYLLKINSFGDVLWSKIYGTSGNDFGLSVCQTSDGGYITGGYTTSGLGSNDVYVIKTDSIGDTLWTKIYGGPGDDKAYRIKQTTDGGYIIAGLSNSFGAGGYGGYLIKTNSTGDTLWTKFYTHPGAAYFYGISQTTDGGYIISGNTGVEVLLIKTDSNGHTGCNDYATHTITNYTSTVVTIPSISVLDTPVINDTVSIYTTYLGCFDTLLCSCNLSLTTQPVNSQCNNCNDGWATVIPNGGTSPFTYSWSTIPVQTTQTATGLSPGNYVVCVTDSFGCSKCDTVTIGLGNCSANFALYPDTTLAHHYWAISYSGGVQPLSYLWSWGDGNYDNIAYPSHIYSGSGFYTICLTITDSVGCTSTFCDSNYYLMRPKEAISMVWVNILDTTMTTGNKINVSSPLTVNVYPNPAKASITFYQSACSANLQLKITNIMGEEIYHQAINNSTQTTIDVSQWSNGVYFYQIRGDKETLRGKFVVEK